MSDRKVRCWPGCVAMVTHTKHSANRGAIVKVLHRVPAEYEDEVLHAPPCRGAPNRPLLTNGGELAGEGWFHDSSLTPITPPPGAEDLYSETERDLVGLV